MSGVAERGKLYSLWDIMNLYDVRGLSIVLHGITQAETGLIIMKMSGHGSQKPDGDALKKAISAFEFATTFFTLYPMGKCAECVKLAKHQWERSPNLDNSAASEIIHRLNVDIISELSSIHFLIVANDRKQFVYIETDSMLGDDVDVKFPSAVRDVKEAAHCLAAECPTAAVFHLMRACEFGLRALARDRDIEFKDKPLDQKEWGQIIPALDAKLKELRETDVKSWSKPEFKELQIRFYGELIPELRSFNEAWRRHISHADTEAFYDRDYALSVMNHVKTFFQKLSIRISENSQTPMYWDTI
jgi:hypothetical protein